MVECFSGLRGQYNSAQGKVSVGTIRNAALGKGYTTKTVHAKMLNKSTTCPWTELREDMYREKETIHFVRNKILSFMNVTARTIFLSDFQPWASLRLPTARLYWPFRPRLVCKALLLV